MTKVIRYTIVVVITLAVLLLLWQFSTAIVLFVLSLAVAAALRPSINSITGRNVSKQLALGIVYALVITSIISFFFLISQPLVQDLQKATDDFVTNYDRAKVEWPLKGTLFQKALAERLPPSADLYKALTSTEEGIPALVGVFGVAQNFFSSLSSIAIVIVLSLYWSADQLRFERLGLSFLPTEYHAKALHIWRSIESGVGAYLRSEFFQSILAGLILWVGYWMMGIRYPTLLALWGAIVRLIPWFGALIAVLPLVFIGIGSSFTLSLLATAYTVTVLLFLKLVIEPRFFHRYRYSSLLIILFVIALAEAFGFIGVVLAPPLAVAVQILFRQLYPFPAERFSPEVLEKAMKIRQRLIGMRGHIRRQANHKNIILINRVRRLVKQTIDHIQEY